MEPISPARPWPARAAVTGANGYVGSCLVEHLRQRGSEVLELRRDATRLEPSHPDRRPYALETPPEPAVFEGVDLLVHCAYDFSPRSRAEIERVNLRGSVGLFDAARRAGVPRVVFISTMSSFEGCKSNYGRVKLAIEGEARARGAVVVRPGLVFGPRPGGMFAALQRIVSLSPLVPLVGSGSQELYLTHEEDLCRLIVEAAASSPESTVAPLIAAAEQPMSFRRILRVMARARGRGVVLVPVPWRWIWAGLRLVELAGLRSGFRSDSVLSLVNQNPRPDFAPTRSLDVRFRPFEVDAPESS